MPRLQFSLRGLLVLMLAVACFFGGVRLGRDRQKREDMLAEQITREERRAQVEKELQAFQALLNQHTQSQQYKWQGTGILGSKPKVTPDVVWENIPDTTP